MMRRFLLLLTLSALAPASAHAFAVFPGYAGGAVPEIFPEVSNPGTVLVSISRGLFSPETGRIEGKRVYFHAQTLCAGGETRGVALTRPVRIGGDSFTASGRVRDTGPLGRRQVVSYKLRATERDGVVTGTLSVRAAIRERGRSTLLRCTTTGAVPFELRDLSQPRGRFSRPVPGASYFGVVGSPFLDVDPFVLRISAGGSRVVATVFAIPLECRIGTLRHVNLTPSFRVGAGGRFSHTERFKDRYTNGVERFEVRVRGRFRTGGVTGTVSVSSRFVTNDGRVGDVCRSGRRTFSALR